MPKDRERLLRALLELAPEAIVIADHSRRIVDINAELTNMFGYTLEDLVGKPTSALYADKLDFMESGKTVFSQNLPATGPKILRQRYRRKDGTVFNARTVAMQLRDEEGYVRGFAGRIENIADFDAEQMAEMEALSTERAVLAALYNKTPAMLFSTGPDGRIEAISDRLTEHLGVQVSEAIGVEWTTFLMDRGTVDPKELFQSVLREGRIVEEPHRLRGKDGVLLEVELSATLETSGEHQRVLAILSDVTRRNRATRQLESRNEQMRQFARIAAHDLRTPLRHISLFAEDVKRALADQNLPEVSEDVEVITASADRLSDMVNGLLEFSVADEKKIVPERVDTSAIVDRILKNYAPDIAECGADIEVEELPVITCDPVLIERVFENLINNALKFRTETGKAEIRLTARSAQSSWIFEIRDNGIGINPAFHSRIFNPLTRLHGVDSKYNGSGIGLSLASRIVEAHGGKIWVDSQEAIGSSFFVELPNYL